MPADVLTEPMLCPAVAPTPVLSGLVQSAKKGSAGKGKKKRKTGNPEDYDSDDYSDDAAPARAGANVGSNAQVAKAAAAALRSIKTSILAQMVYKASIKA